jgi:hypothetical protein
MGCSCVIVQVACDQHAGARLEQAKTAAFKWRRSTKRRCRLGRLMTKALGHQADARKLREQALSCPRRICNTCAPAPKVYLVAPPARLTVIGRRTKCIRWFVLFRAGEGQTKCRMNSSLNLVMRFGGIAAQADQSYIPPTKQKNKIRTNATVDRCICESGARFAISSKLSTTRHASNQTSVISGFLLGRAFGGLLRAVVITALRILSAAIIYPSLEQSIAFRRGGSVQSNSRSGYRNPHVRMLLI